MSFRTLDEQTSKQVHHKMNKNKIFVVRVNIYIWYAYAYCDVIFSLSSHARFMVSLDLDWYDRKRLMIVDDFKQSEEQKISNFVASPNFKVNPEGPQWASLL
jgi:hypothetical protein